MAKLELGTLSMTVSVKGHKLIDGTPRLDLLQDNLREVLPLVPDGIYQWVLVMDIDAAERLDENG